MERGGSRIAARYCVGDVAGERRGHPPPLPGDERAGFGGVRGTRPSSSRMGSGPAPRRRTCARAREGHPVFQPISPRCSRIFGPRRSVFGKRAIRCSSSFESAGPGPVAAQGSIFELRICGRSVTASWCAARATATGTRPSKPRGCRIAALDKSISSVPDHGGSMLELTNNVAGKSDQFIARRRPGNKGRRYPPIRRGSKKSLRS